MAHERGNGSRQLPWGNLLSATAIVIALSSSILGNYSAWIRTGSNVETIVQQHSRELNELKVADAELKAREEKLHEAIAGMQAELARRNQQLEYCLTLLARIETLIEKSDVRTIETREALLQRMATVEAIMTRWLERMKH